MSFATRIAQLSPSFTSPVKMNEQRAGIRVSVNTNAPPKAYSVAVAVEKGAVAGVAGGRTTRIVVIGDSTAFNNQMLVSAANRDFVRLALNWLVDRPQLLENLGPRPATEFMMLMTRKQWITSSLILLAGLPGAALFVGSLVWLRRRK